MINIFDILGGFRYVAKCTAKDCAISFDAVKVLEESVEELNADELGITEKSIAAKLDWKREKKWSKGTVLAILPVLSSAHTYNLFIYFLSTYHNDENKNNIKYRSRLHVIEEMRIYAQRFINTVCELSIDTENICYSYDNNFKCDQLIKDKPFSLTMVEAEDTSYHNLHGVRVELNVRVDTINCSKLELNCQDC